jgi:benzoyl-CoA reductase/2-hydroxyglutaryl-CoA dehydratase subunit BcrC/BadD/HgdB
MDIAIPRRSEVIQQHKGKGGQIAAVFPIHYPRALLRAFDIQPIEVWGPPGVDTGPGDAHLQAYVCTIVKNGLSFLLSGGLDVCDFIMVPHGCDSLQGLGSILLDFVKPKQTVLPFYVPRQDRDASIDFLTDEFKSIEEKLRKATGKKPSVADLVKAVHREEAADLVLADLFNRRRRLPLSNLEFYRLVRSREYLPAEVFAEIGHKTLEQGGQPDPQGTGVVLSGLVPEPMDLLEVISKAGAVVVADDFACSGRRLYTAGKGQEPHRRMANSILTAAPDSTRGSSVEDRIRHLVKLCQGSGAKGVIFYDIKFCEPEQFYIPQVRAGLEQAGIRSVAMEGDLEEKTGQQLVTRIEAFLETLQ